MFGWSSAGYFGSLFVGVRSLLFEKLECADVVDKDSAIMLFKYPEQEEDKIPLTDIK